MLLPLPLGTRMNARKSRAESHFRVGMALARPEDQQEKCEIRTVLHAPEVGAES